MSTRNAIRAAAAFILICWLSTAPTFGTRAYGKDAPPGGNGALENVKGISVVSLSGTPSEIGHMHGVLLGDRMLETEAAFRKLMPPIPGGFIGEWLVRTFIMFQLGDIEEHLTAGELDEMKGMAEAGPDDGKDYRDLLYYHVLQDIGQNYACTGGAACGSSSALNGPVAGRNFDLNKDGVLDPLKTVFFYDPDEGPSYATVAWPGMVGAVTGMNEHGLCVMVFSARSEETSLSGVPVAFLARRLLANASSVDEAVELMRSAEKMGPNTFLVVDTKRAAAVEFDACTVAVRETADGLLPVANHFLCEGFCGDEKNAHQACYSDSPQRLERIGRLLGASSPVGVDDMLDALRDHSGPDGRLLAWGDPAAVNNTKDAHSVIFDPAGRRFWVSTPPAAYGEFIGFRLGAKGLTRTSDLPGSGYPASEDGRTAECSHELYTRAAELAGDGYKDEAAGEAWLAMCIDPTNYMAATLYGTLCMEGYRYSDAFTAFDSAVTNAPGCYPAMADALAWRGQAARKMGMHDQARSDFNEVLGMDCSEQANDRALYGLEYL